MPRNLPVYLSLIFVTILVHFDALAQRFAFADDYEKILLKGNEAYALYSADGRLLYAKLLWIFSKINSIQDLIWIRVISILGVSFLCYSLYFVAKRFSWPQHIAISYSLAVVTCIPLTLYIAWSSLYLFPYACLLALLSFYCLEKSSNRLNLNVFLSIILLFLSLTIYQPAVGFFWVGLAIFLLANDKDLKGVIKSLFASTSLFSFVILTYLGFYKYGIWPFSTSPSQRGSGMVTDIVQRLYDVSRYALLDSLSLSSISQSWIVAGFSISVILLGMFFRIQRLGRSTIPSCLVCLGLVPITYLPNILSSAASYGFRTQAALHVLILFLFFEGLREIFHSRMVKYLQVVIAIFLLTSFFQAKKNLSNNFIQPAQTEYSLIKSELLKSLATCPADIHVIRPSYNDSLALLRYDEFGSPSTVQEWGPVIVLRVILEEIFEDCSSTSVSSSWLKEKRPGVYNLDIPALLKR